MNGQLYLRVRGRVLGPYDRDKLQSLVQRGQLSRMHEVSEDGAVWERAAKYPDLFASTGEAPSAPAQYPATALPSQPAAQPTTGGYTFGGKDPAPQHGYPPNGHLPNGQPQFTQPNAAPAPAAPRWMYARGASEFGPVDFAALLQLAGAGQLAPDDQVWKEGTAEWVRADTVLRFPTSPAASAQSAAQSSAVQSSAAQSAAPSGSAASAAPSVKTEGRVVSLRVVRAYSGAKPWILLTGVLAFLWGAMHVLVGLGFLSGFGTVQSAQGSVLVAALLQFVSAGVFITLGVLLCKYSAKIEDLRGGQTMTDLEATAEAGRSFWMFLGIVELVLIVLALVGAIVVVFVVFMTGMALRGMFSDMDRDLSRVPMQPPTRASAYVVCDRERPTLGFETPAGITFITHGNTGSFPC